MSPICPMCGSGFVVPDSATVGGAGRDVCMNCGYRAAVREFYPQAKYGDIVMDYRQSDDGNATIYRATMFTGGEYGRFDPNAITEWDKKTGTIKPASSNLHTDKPAAPIRQYKDD